MLPVLATEAYAVCFLVLTCTAEASSAAAAAASSLPPCACITLLTMQASCPARCHIHCACCMAQAQHSRLPTQAGQWLAHRHAWHTRAVCSRLDNCAAAPGAAGVMPGAPPEFVPPEQSPPGPAQPTDPPRPGRIARPEVCWACAACQKLLLQCVPAGLYHKGLSDTGYRALQSAHRCVMCFRWVESRGANQASMVMDWFSCPLL